MSPTPDSALADPQQVIAELRNELAEMRGRLAEALAERDEGEAQKVAMTEVLQVMNSSPGDLAPVFDAMLEKAMRLCEAAFGILLVRDGSRFETAALHGVPPPLAEFLSRTPREPGKHTAVGRMLDGEGFVYQNCQDRSGLTGHLSLAHRLACFVDDAHAGLLHRHIQSSILFHGCTSP